MIQQVGPVQWFSCKTCGLPSTSHASHPSGREGCGKYDPDTRPMTDPDKGIDAPARQRLDILERDYIHKDTLHAILEPLRAQVKTLASRDTWLGEIEDARDSLAKDLCVMEVKLKQAEARVGLLEDVASAAAVILGDQGRNNCHADDPTASCWPNKRLRRALDAVGVK